VIELPEAVTIARQLDGELRGRRIVEAAAGNTPHKWVFFRPSRDEVLAKVPKRVVREVTAFGSGVRLHLKPALTLVVEGFGGRLLLHEPGGELPKKYHLLVTFGDESFLTLAVQGWGFVRTDTGRGLPTTAVSPLAKEFTQGRLNRLLDGCDRPDRDSIKLFFTCFKHVAGIGNGYLQGNSSAICSGRRG
jgi:formamidopyrimidine-DNA glycosylase